MIIYLLFVMESVVTIYIVTKVELKFKLNDHCFLYHLYVIYRCKNITFLSNSEIKYRVKDEDTECDLNKVLNLNCATLVENRKRVKNAVFNTLLNMVLIKNY